MYPDIHIGNNIVYSWHLLLFLGYAVSFALIFVDRPEDFPMSRPKMAAAFLTAVIFSWPGAILLNIILNLNNYIQLSADKLVDAIGVASLGGLFTGFIAVWLLSKIMRFSFEDALDYGFHHIILILAFNRIGCLMAGCCYGIPTGLPWGFEFLYDGISRHPTQAYAMASAFAVFGASRFAYKHLKRYKGITFNFTLTLYCLLRIINEFLRAEGPRIYGQFKVSHIFLIAISAIGILNIRKICSSLSKDDISLVKATSYKSMIRLVIWFAISLSFPLLIIHISNRIWF
jgi:phosphatidylglycerol:prolipoprotein diacylglycerol transferase